MALFISTFLLVVIFVYSSVFTDISEADECCCFKKYELYSGSVTFANALQLCNDMGAELATVLNDDEHQAIEKVVLAAAVAQKNGSPQFVSWIGGIRCKDCNNNAKEFIWLPKGQKQVYTHFRATQPDNFAGNQSCLTEVHYQEGNETAWDDQACDELRNYICQRRLC